MLTGSKVPYTPVSSSNNTAGLDPATQERLERMENVLSVVVRHNPGIGGYDAVRDWLNCKSRFPRHGEQGGAWRYGAPDSKLNMARWRRHHPLSWAVAPQETPQETRQEHHGPRASALCGLSVDLLLPGVPASQALTGPRSHDCIPSPILQFLAESVAHWWLLHFFVCAVTKPVASNVGSWMLALWTMPDRCLGVWPVGLIPSKRTGGQLDPPLCLSCGGAVGKRAAPPMF